LVQTNDEEALEIIFSIKQLSSILMEYMLAEEKEKIK
jgi:hypothetical protein